jgi:hypothetical protein
MLNQTFENFKLIVIDEGIEDQNACRLLNINILIYKLSIMKSKLISVIIMLPLIMTNCGKENKQSASDVITIDVTTNYPEKELIIQDFMDVEYIALDEADEFLTQGIVMDIGKEIILVQNRVRDGNIFVFDRTGKGLRKINRRGQGSEEYLHTTAIILDEDNDEMFIKDYPARKFVVYDLYGNFKRSFKFTGSDGYYTSVFNYDREYLICYNNYPTTNKKQSTHLLVSKQDGSVVREIQIPSKEIKTPTVIDGEFTITVSTYPIIPYHDCWALVETSSDTVYSYFPENKMLPLIVRTPSIYSMQGEIFLLPNILTDRYYFMQTHTKEFNFETMKGHPRIDLVHDRQENATFKSAVYNDDFLHKRRMDMGGRAFNHEIAFCERLEAFDLVEAYKNDELKGRLKEIAAKMNEESNPVIMLVKHRK